MIVKMRFLNISGPRDDIDRVCEKYLSKYEMQIENAVTELKTTENIMPFVEVNPYRDPLAKAEQFCNHSYGDWICQCRTYEPSPGNFRYFWCEYRNHHDCTVNGI